MREPGILPCTSAVMAAYDQRGAQVLQACDGTGLSVPKRVQVLGVDDDPVFCKTYGLTMRDYRRTIRNDTRR